MDDKETSKINNQLTESQLQYVRTTLSIFDELSKGDSYQENGEPISKDVNNVHNINYKHNAKQDNS